MTMMNSTINVGPGRSAAQLEYASARKALADNRLAARVLEHDELYLLGRAFRIDPDQDATLQHAKRERQIARDNVTAADAAVETARGDADWSQIAEMLAVAV